MAPEHRGTRARAVPTPLRRGDGSSILLAVRPEYASLIYSGRKTIELRRVAPSRKIGRVFIYETAPQGRVTGWFDVARIEVVSPATAWKRFSARIAVTFDRFRAYLNGAKAAVLIHVGRARRLGRASPRRRMRTTARPPQSFVYLSPRQARVLIRAGATLGIRRARLRAIPYRMA